MNDQMKLPMTRRTLINAASGALLATTTAGAGRAAAPGTKSFPKGFLWGAATAGHQVEGNNVNADMWVTEHVKPTYFMAP